MSLDSRPHLARQRSLSGCRALTIALALLASALSATPAWADTTAPIDTLAADTIVGQTAWSYSPVNGVSVQNGTIRWLERGVHIQADCSNTTKSPATLTFSFVDAGNATHDLAPITVGPGASSTPCQSLFDNHVPGQGAETVKITLSSNQKQLGTSQTYTRVAPSTSPSGIGGGLPQDLGFPPCASSALQHSVTLNFTLANANVTVQNLSFNPGFVSAQSLQFNPSCTSKGVQLSGKFLATFDQLSQFAIQGGAQNLDAVNLQITYGGSSLYAPLPLFYASGTPSLPIQDTGSTGIPLSISSQPLNQTVPRSVSDVPLKVCAQAVELPATLPAMCDDVSVPAGAVTRASG